jgi:glutamate formiminotransferase/formiminotetrahydrofolate cyclodeaminase
MNLTNYRKTTVARVVELIRREASRYGVAVTFSELVGLAPQEFFVEAARWYLQLDMFEPDQILEYRIHQAEAASPLAQEEPPIPDDASRPVETIPSAPLIPEPFINAVAEGTPAPGGGAVAALAGSLSAALAEMVARLTVGKKRYAEVEESMSAIIAAAAALRQRLVAAIDDDIRAFNAVMDAYRLPQDLPERADAIQSSTIGAADVPLNVARIVLDVMLLVEQVVKQGNVNAASDAAVAGLMGLAAIEGAALNVRVNVANLDDADLAARYNNDIVAIVDQARDLRDVVVATAEQRAGIAAQA